MAAAQIETDMDAAYTELAATGIAQLVTVDLITEAAIIESPDQPLLAGRVIDSSVTMRYRSWTFPSLSRSDIVTIGPRSYRVDSVEELPGYKLEKIANLSEI